MKESEMNHPKTTSFIAEVFNPETEKWADGKDRTILLVRPTFTPQTVKAFVHLPSVIEKLKNDGYKHGDFVTLECLEQIGQDDKEGRVVTHFKDKVSGDIKPHTKTGYSIQDIRVSSKNAFDQERINEVMDIEVMRSAKTDEERSGLIAGYNFLLQR